MELCGIYQFRERRHYFTNVRAKCPSASTNEVPLNVPISRAAVNSYYRKVRRDAQLQALVPGNLYCFELYSRTLPTGVKYHEAKNLGSFPNVAQTAVIGPSNPDKSKCDMQRQSPEPGRHTGTFKQTYRYNLAGNQQTKMWVLWGTGKSQNPQPYYIDEAALAAYRAIQSRSGGRVEEDGTCTFLTKPIGDRLEAYDLQPNIWVSNSKQ